jgi:hypothetical protein
VNFAKLFKTINLVLGVHDMVTEKDDALVSCRWFPSQLQSAFHCARLILRITEACLKDVKDTCQSSLRHRWARTAPHEGDLRYFFNDDVQLSAIVRPLKVSGPIWPVAAVVAGMNC